MSEEAGFEVARAFVAVDPDASDFADSLDEQVGGLQVSVLVVPQASDFAQSFDEQVGSLTATVAVAADTSAAQGTVDSFVENTDSAQALLKIGADTADALSSAAAATAEIDGSTADITVGADTATGQASVTALIDEVNEARADLTIGADLTGAEGRAGALTEELGGNSAEIEVGANTAPARSEVASLVEDVDSARADMLIGADAGPARAQAEALTEEFSGLSGDVGLSVSGGDTDSVAALSGDMEQLADSSQAAAGALTGVHDSISAVENAAETAASAVAGISGALAGGLVGDAPVHVTPDMSGFGAEVTEGAAGITVPVRAVPDLAQFTEQVDEETTGLAARVALVPDTADFQQRVDEETGGLTATVTVEADIAQAEASVRDFADGGVTAFAEVEAASTAAAASVDEYWSQPRMLQGLPAAMQASIDAFNGVGQAAAEDGAQVESALDALESRVGALGANLTGVDGDFQRFAAANTSAADEADQFNDSLGALSGRLEGLHEGYADIQGQIASFREELAAATTDGAAAEDRLLAIGTSFQGFAQGVAGASADLEGMAGEWLANQEAAQRLGVTLDELPAKMEALSASYAAGRAQSEAGLAALNGEAAGLTAMGGAAEETAVKAGGLSTVIGELGGRLSYMAVDPFMWMMAAPLLIDGVTSATKALSTELTPLGAALNEQTKAADYNSASWDQVAATQSKVAQQGGLVGQVMADASEKTSAAADTLGSHISTLETTYGLTAAQAQALAAAAGVSAVQLSASGDAGDKAMTKIEAYADANVGAQGAVNELSNDMSTFSNNTLTASTRVSALDDAFNLLDGNFVSGQQAQLQVQQDFLTIASNADIAGASMKGTNTQSLQLQQSFYSTIPAIEQTANAMVKQGSSTQQVTAYIEAQIAQLTPLAAHNQQAEQAVQGLKQWEDQLTTSVGENTGALTKAASTLQSQFTAQVKSAGDTSKATQSEIQTLTTAILGTGTGSTSSAAARAQLISDLEKSGVNAQTATSMVDAYIKKIAAIPTSKALTLTESASGTWSMSELLSTGAANVGALPGAKPVAGSATVAGLAGGGLVGEGSKIPRADDVDARLSRNEYVVQADAVDHYGVGMLDSINAMHFADGGSVGGSYTGSLSGAGDFAQTQYVNVENSLAAALEAAINQAESAAKAKATAAAAAASSGSTAGAPTSGVAAQNMAALKAAAAAHGWTGAEWDALNQVEMMEAGYSLTATNPSSGAYGMAQFIQGPSEYADYGGNASTAAGQAAAMTNYISQRYGDPEAALAHEECVPLSVEILTRRGWLTYNQLREGDETLGFNPDTGLNEWTPIYQVHVYADAPLVRLTNKTWEAVCTPQHRWAAVHWKHVGRKGSEGRTKNEYARVNVMVETRKITSRHSLRLSAVAETGEGPAIDEREAELLGWVLGDGSVAHLRERGKSGAPFTGAVSIRLYQSKPGHVAAIDELVNGLMFNRMTRPMIKPSGEPGLPLVTWEFTQAYSAELLKRSGYDHKNPVPFVLSLSPAQREAFMRGVFGAEGWLAGNGSFAGLGTNPTGKVYPKTKTYLQNDGAQQDAIVLGAYLCGHRPGISERDNRGLPIGRWTVSTVAACIRETKPFLGGEKIKREDAGRGPVFCVTTALGTWTMRQGRQVMLTGNSFHWYDQGGYMPTGPSMSMNRSGVPERVLPPGSDVMAADDVAAAVGGAGRTAPTFIVNYYGTMHPTPEQQQAMIMQLTQQLAMV